MGIREKTIFVCSDDETFCFRDMAERHQCALDVVGGTPRSVGLTVQDVAKLLGALKQSLAARQTLIDYLQSLD